jgi:hypothetical protein
MLRDAVLSAASKDHAIPVRNLRPAILDDRRHRGGTSRHRRLAIGCEALSAGQFRRLLPVLVPERRAGWHAQDVHRRGVGRIPLLALGVVRVRGDPDRVGGRRREGLAADSFAVRLLLANELIVPSLNGLIGSRREIKGKTGTASEYT